MKLYMTIEVASDQADPALTDPFDIANDIIEEYSEWARNGQGIQVQLVEADWAS